MTLALLLTAVGGAWAQTETLLTTITPTGNDSYSETTAGVVTVTPSNVGWYSEDYGWCWLGSGSVTVEAKEGYTITRCVFKQKDKTPVTITTSPFAITFNDGGKCEQNGSMDGVSPIEVYGFAPAPPIEVTTNAAEEGATFTEASFVMPTYDVDVNYELVRDMSVQMPVTVQDAEQNSRFRVQKQDNTFVPVGMDMDQIVALFTVHDDIEDKNLTANTDYTVQLFAVDEEGQKTGVAIPFNDFTFAPGNYVAMAVAASNSNYEGETALSNVFTLFQGYEIKVAAGEYATYYKDEALKVEDEEVELLTITAVEDGKAVLSDASDAMTANTPFLVHNNGIEEKTILLIPCNEPNLAITWADEFIGTLTEKNFTDQEMGAGDFYVCNGKEFIQVRGRGTLAANRAYLKVTGNAPASIPFRRSIDGGEGTTGVDLIDNGKLIIDNDGWYDLNGRKLNGKPSQKGVYIKNGKKIVIK